MPFGLAGPTGTLVPHGAVAAACLALADTTAAGATVADATAGRGHNCQWCQDHRGRDGGTNGAEVTEPGSFVGFLHVGTPISFSVKGY